MALTVLAALYEPVLQNLTYLRVAALYPVVSCGMWWVSVGCRMLSLGLLGMVFLLFVAIAALGERGIVPAFSCVVPCVDLRGC